MRAWILPKTDVYELDEDNNHSLSVLRDPERFGLRRDVMADYETSLEDDFTDFDYDTLIAMASMNGWVRTSRDCDKGQVAASGSSARSIRLALLDLEARGVCFDKVDVEMERIERGCIERSYAHLDGQCYWDFLRSGRLPALMASSMPIIVPELLHALRGDASDAAAAPRL